MVQHWFVKDFQPGKQFWMLKRKSILDIRSTGGVKGPFTVLGFFEKDMDGPTTTVVAYEDCDGSTFNADVDLLTCQFIFGTNEEALRYQEQFGERGA